MERLLKNFIEYVKIDTQSDPNSDTVPSTMKQKDLSKLLVSQLKDLNIEAFLDEYGYVYAKIEKNLDENIPGIGFIAHVDTSFDAPGYPVNPKIIKNYDGSEIVLNEHLKMDVKSFDVLKGVVGHDLIVTDGNTLLGADDKAGVAEIMEIAYILFENPSIKHGDIYICFTPDEEIGRGANYFNYDWFKADFAYTLDGSKVGGVEYENFNAASAIINFTGISIHPGSAKGKMINAVHLAYEFHSLLPKNMTPSLTEGYEGFNHLTNINGSVEEANANYIIRNHDKVLFNLQKEEFVLIKNKLNQKYGYEAVKLELIDSYYNMANIVNENYHIIELANEATIKAGIKPFSEPIRGGTDGARLTYEGLICPNLGTGGYNYHGRYEFASYDEMKKAVEIVLNIINLHTNKYI